MGLCSGEDRLDSTLNITRKVGIYSQTAGWGGSVNGKLLRGHIGGEGGFWQKEPNEILAEGRPGWSDITWGCWGVRHLIRY